MFDPHDAQSHELEFTTEADARGPALPKRPEGFQLPPDLWRAMLVLYAIFIASLALATGGSGPARLSLAVAALFMLVYFATAAILAGLGGPDRNRVGPARPLQTIYGPLSARDVWFQVLVIPGALAIFGIAVLIVVVLARA